MKTPLIKSKKGFTIIEVSLVLAIGGLIMLMVFIAWPAVQRNQRDSQRRNTDLPRLFSSVSNYMVNNSGKLPAVPDPAGTNFTVVGAEDGPATGTGTGTDKWTTFYNNYLRANGDSFIDPAGTAYSLSIVDCSATGDKNAPNKGLTTIGKVCDGIAKAANATDTTITIGDGTTGRLVDGAFEKSRGTIVIVVGAKCDGETAVSATAITGGTRKFAIMYALESGGVYCESN